MNKQETLEEAAERIYSDKEYSMYGEIRRHSFIAGAKWYQEQDKKLYSEEDLKEAFYQGWVLSGAEVSFREAINKWFEQNKKK
jgi:hypothetical protein